MERLPYSLGRNIWLSTAYSAINLEDLQRSKPQLIQDAIDRFPYIQGQATIMQGFYLELLKNRYNFSTRNKLNKLPFYYFGIEVILPEIYHTPERNLIENPKSLRLFDKLEGISTYLDVTPLPSWQKLLINNTEEFYTDFNGLKSQKWGPKPIYLNAVYCPLFPDQFKLIGTEDFLQTQGKTVGKRSNSSILQSVAQSKSFL